MKEQEVFIVIPEPISGLFPRLMPPLGSLSGRGNTRRRCNAKRSIWSAPTTQKRAKTRKLSFVRRSAGRRK